MIRSSSQTVDPKTGSFTLKSLPEAKFSILVNGLPPDAYISDLRQGTRNAYSDGVIDETSDDNLSEPIQITVKPRGGTLQGMVQNANQEAVRNAGVVLVPNAPRRGNSLLYKRVTADTSGRFSIRGIAPGGYKIFAWPSLPEGSAEENDEFIAPFELRGTAVDVEAAGSANVQVRVIPQ